MDCRHCWEMLSARLDGELGPEEVQTLEEHLAQCPECRSLAGQLEGLHQDFQNLEEEPAPEGFARGVMERVAARGGRSRVISLFRRPQVRAMAGLAACAVLCAGLYSARWLSREGQADVQGYAVQEDGGASVSAQGFLRQADSPLVAAAPEEETRFADGGADIQNAQTKAAGTVLTLERLPEGAQALLEEQAAVRLADGGLLYEGLTREQLDGLEALAREQDIPAALSGEEGEGCALLVSQES